MLNLITLLRSFAIMSRESALTQEPQGVATEARSEPLAPSKTYPPLVELSKNE